MEFEQKRSNLIGIRLNNTELERIKEVCDYYNITHANLFRSMFKNYYDEFKEEKQEKTI